MNRFAALAVFAASVLSFSGCDPKVAKKAIGQEAPSLSLPMLGSGNTWELEPLLGRKNVLLAFYTTWCPYCNQSMPYLEDFYRKNKDKNFEFVAIDIGEPEETVAEFAKKYGLSGPVLLARQDQIASTYPVRYLPTLYLIGKNGTLIKTFEGFHPSALDEIGKLIGS